MKQTKRLVGALACLALGSACVEETGSLLVLRNDLRTSGECSPEPGLEGTGLSRGTLDIMLSTRYVMFPVVFNTLKPSSEVRIQSGGAGGGGATGQDKVQVEGNIVSLESATVSIIAPGVNFVVPQNVEIPTSGAVFPTGVISTGLEVISPVLGDLIRTSIDFQEADGTFKRGTVITVLVSVQFKGTSSSGTEIESNEFTFPLDICAGCLLYYAPDTIVPAADNVDRPTCDPIDRAIFERTQAEEGDGGTDVANDLTIPCLIGQDELVDCRLCRTLAVVGQNADAICDPPQSLSQ